MLVFMFLLSGWGGVEYSVEFARLRLLDEAGELLCAHLDLLAEVVGDDDLLLRCGVRSEVDLWAAASGVATSAYGAEVGQRVGHGLPSFADTGCDQLI
ncbi:hypothetical protein [Nonomuraea diastatica]|uniref:hypothetical protein n=1 Tax=Nonomuraea diastatica TaxID=1848329 RepID=UPI001C709E3A|nr:hypothetical protein [Nonomuraea diastatica]